jgi:hypothetical protein
MRRKHRYIERYASQAPTSAPVSNAASPLAAQKNCATFLPR